MIQRDDRVGRVPWGHEPSASPRGGRLRPRPSRGGRTPRVRRVPARGPHRSGAIPAATGAMAGLPSQRRLPRRDPAAGAVRGGRGPRGLLRRLNRTGVPGHCADPHPLGWTVQRQHPGQSRRPRRIRGGSCRGQRCRPAAQPARLRHRRLRPARGGAQCGLRLRNRHAAAPRHHRTRLHPGGRGRVRRQLRAAERLRAGLPPGKSGMGLPGHEQRGARRRPHLTGLGRCGHQLLRRLLRQRHRLRGAAHLRRRDRPHDPGVPGGSGRGEHPRRTVGGVQRRDRGTPGTVRNPGVPLLRRRPHRRGGPRRLHRRVGGHRESPNTGR